jgi:hypothetical protein
MILRHPTAVSLQHGYNNLQGCRTCPFLVFSQLKYGIAKFLELRPKINATHGRVGVCQQHAF